MLRLLLAVLVFASTAALGQDIRIGSKKFTESVILGEMLVQLATGAGAQAHHRRELGGTRVLWEALKRGDIDAYVEYTGTLSQEILAGRGLAGEDAIRGALAPLGIVMGAPLGFNNTYAIGMPPQHADRLGISRISDLRGHAGLRFGFGNEFMDRHDGWPGLKARYRLPQSEVRGLDHDLAYRGLEAGSIDAMDVYTTDAEISYYRLRLLVDDLGYFPIYKAVIVHRRDLAARAPDVAAAFARLAGLIDETAMAGLNRRVKLDREPEAVVAADFLASKLGLAASGAGSNIIDRLVRNTLEHLALVAVSLGAAIGVSVPLGVYAARRPRTGQVILAVTGIVQTIPSLALFVFMIPLLGIGGPPAVVALFLYSLLPIVRNTHAGFHDIAPSVIESADALGLGQAAKLRLVELPIAARAILAGIKTSAVINVGTATLGALIGAGGYGQPILTGIRLDDTGLILEGAVPAALLALLVQGLFELAERACVAKGLRLSAAS